MALLQRYPAFTPSLSNADRGHVVTKAPTPKALEFRNGGDLSALIDAVGKGGSYALDAAPGAGKTTRFPVELAKASKGLVVHTMPYEHLAYSVNRYIASKPQGVAVAAVWDVETSWPEAGVVHTTPSVVVAKWLTAGKLSMPRCVLLQDESHENGSASAALRAFAHLCPGVDAYVQMTATSGIEAVRAMETGGRVDQMRFDPSVHADPWSVSEDTAPWAAEEQDGNLVVFEDEEVRAVALRNAYAKCGLSAFRFNYKSTGKSVVDAKEFAARSTTPVVFVLDSTFRSGHTFDAVRVIDCGKVTRLCVSAEGQLVKYRRNVYAFEAEQAAARVGRIRGAFCQYFRPAVELGRVMCDLGQSDVEAFVLICRALGYKPPAYVAKAHFAAGVFPINLCAALNDANPLTRQPREAFSDLAKTVTDSVARVDSPEACASAGLATVSPLQSLSDDLDGFAEKLSNDGLRRAEFGEYAVALGVNCDSFSCAALPDGAASVLRLLSADSAGTLPASWPLDLASVAANALVSSYNGRLVEVRALSAALRQLKSSAVLPANRRSCFVWVKRAAERAGALTSMMRAEWCALQEIAKRRFVVGLFQHDFSNEENKVSSSLLSQFADNVAFEAVDTASALSRLVGSVVDDAVKPVPRLSSASSFERGSSASAVSALSRGSARSSVAANYTGHVGYLRRSANSGTSVRSRSSVRNGSVGSAPLTGVHKIAGFLLS